MSSERAHLAAIATLDEEGLTGQRLWDLEVIRAAVDIDNALAAPEAKQGPRRFFRIDGESLLDMEFPATPWLIRGLMKDHGLHGVAAEPKNIKTWVMMEKCFAVASGAPAFGEFEMCGEPGHVAVFAGEDHLRACKAKLRAIGASKNIAADRMREIARRFHFEALTRIDVRNKAHLAELVASARALPETPKLMTFDPLIKVHGAKENDSTEMEVVSGNLAAVGKVVGCTVEFVHHNNKGPNDGKSSTRRGGQKMRGSSSLHGAVDGGLYLDPPTGNRNTEWTVRIESEIKGARSAAPFTVTLRVLEDDEHGEARLIAWDVSKDAGIPEKKRPGPKANATKDDALRILREEFEAANDEDRDPNPISARFLADELGVAKSTAAEWLKQFYNARPPIAYVTEEGGVYLPTESRARR